MGLAIGLAGVALTVAVIVLDRRDARQLDGRPPRPDPSSAEGWKRTLRALGSPVAFHVDDLEDETKRLRAMMRSQLLGRRWALVLGVALSLAGLVAQAVD